MTVCHIANTILCTKCADNKSDTFVVQKGGHDVDAVLRSGGETAVTNEDRNEEGVTEHANNEPAVAADDSFCRLLLSYFTVLMQV